MVFGSLMKNRLKKTVVKKTPETDKWQCTMKTMVSIAVTLFLSCWVSWSQGYSYDKYPNKFELSVGGQLFSGDGDMTDFLNLRTGFRFHPGWSFRAGYAIGTGNDWKFHRVNLVDWGIARVSRNMGLADFEMHTTFGAGYRWDNYSGDSTGKVLGMVEIESRYYVSPKGYLGTTLKAYAGKNHVQTSFLGITWGIRF